MKFRNRNDETAQMVENLCLILSLGAIFTQIWVLMLAVGAYLEGKYERLGPSLILSAAALACCALMAVTTTLKNSSSKQGAGE